MEQPMNRVTLTFKNSKIEELYQTNNLNIRKPILYCTILSLLLFNLIGFLNYFNPNDGYNLGMHIGVITFALTSAIIGWIFPNQISILLILSNYALSLNQLYLMPQIGPYSAFLAGSNITAVQFLIILVCDFKNSLHQIIIQMVLRVYIASSKEQLQIFPYIYSTILVICEILIIYLNDKSQRNRFLLGFKEDQWEQYLPILIRKPFVLFEFKNDYFQPIKMHLIQTYFDWQSHLCEGCNLRRILRQLQYQKQSFEQYIYSRIITKTKCELNKEFSCNINKNLNLQFVYSEFKSVKNSYLLVFDQKQNKKKQKTQTQKHLKSFFINYTLQLKQLYSRPLHKNRLIQLNMHYLSMLHLQDRLIVYFKCYDILKKLKQIFGLHRLKLINLAEFGQIKGFKNLFQVYFIQIFIIFQNLITQGELVVLTIKETETDVIIIFHLNMKEQFSQIYNKNHLIKKIELELVESIDYKELTFIFHKSVNQIDYY